MLEYSPDHGCLWLKAEIDPVAQGRPRFSRFRGKVRTRDPGKSRQFKNSLRDIAEKLGLQKKVTPFSDALAVFVTFTVARPPSVSERKRKYPLVKPDLDNYAKSVLDALNGVFWYDDGQVTFLELQKHYAEPGERPGIDVIIEPAGWHMFRHRSRDEFKMRIAQKAGIPVTAEPRAVGFEINFTEESK